MAGSRVNQAGINALFAPGGEIGRWHNRVVRQVRAEIMRRAPVDTGRLRSSWRVKNFAPTGNRMVSTVYTDVNYAGYVVSGGPEWIYPRSKKFLRFRGRGGEWVFARRVRGAKPNNFVQDGLMAGAGRTHRIKLRVPRR